MANEFAIAEGRRIEITQEQARQIRDMYQGIRQDFAKEVQSISHRTNISSVMRTQYLNSFQKDLESEMTVLNARLEGLIKSNTLEIARAVVLDSDNLAKEMGFNGIFTNEYYIPNQVVNDLISGRLYEGKWSLSQAIWSDNQKKLSDIDQIIATGVAENKSTYDIAKDLERYVNPNARKDWSWSKVYPGSNKVVDYNAQRLARTMVSHAYQESFVQSTKDNPFIESYRWLASGGDRMCELCAERDGQIFAKDELPMDHPNGMCTFEVVIEQSYEDIARSLHDWINDEGDPELNSELDNYAETLGYNVKAWTGNSEQVKNITVQVEDVKAKLEEFVSGTGQSVSGVFANNPEGLRYIEDHMQTYTKTFYRMEESRFTADGLKVGDTFSFNGNLRSFSGSFDGIEQVARDINEFDDVSSYVMFKTVGEQKAFDINSFIENEFFANQDEYLLGGKFEVVRIREAEIVVDNIVHRIKQIIIK